MLASLTSFAFFFVFGLEGTARVRPELYEHAAIL
jgi:hypothetical protein